MCRLLIVKSEKEFDIGHHLRKFSEISRNSTEYQGDGWGCAYLKGNEWKFYRNINPIWDDNLNQFGRTTQLVVHARSAFRNEDIKVENNMPFHDGKYVFILNGELHGVKIREKGRIGAEKIFNFIKKFDNGNFLEAMKKGIEIIKKKSSYVKSMNIIVSDKSNVYVGTFFNERSEYFTLHYKKDKDLMICSESYPKEKWNKIDNGIIRRFQ